MKLNPFSKKTTTGYYERIKTEFAEVKQRVAEAQAAADEAKADAEAKRKHAFELEQRGNQHSVSEQERHARLASSAAQNRAGDLERKLSPLKTKLNELRHIIEAPGKLDSARTVIIELRRRRNSLQTDRAQHANLIAKLQKRIGELEQRIAAETLSASETMAAAEDEFVLPEALTKLDIELRVARATLENVTGKVQALDIDIAAIPNQLREAERSFEPAQATVAKIELHEQLQHLYDVLARASVADHACGYRSHRESKYEIDIPHEYIEAARAKLASEMPGA
jgi:predicted  nucleic acid-binding Zn-ribbon protein